MVQYSTIGIVEYLTTRKIWSIYRALGVVVPYSTILVVYNKKVTTW